MKKNEVLEKFKNELLDSLKKLIAEVEITSFGDTDKYSDDENYSYQEIYDLKKGLKKHLEKVAQNAFCTIDLKFPRKSVNEIFIKGAKELALVIQSEVEKKYYDDETSTDDREERLFAVNGFLDLANKGTCFIEVAGFIKAYLGIMSRQLSKDALDFIIAGKDGTIPLELWKDIFIASIEYEWNPQWGYTKRGKFWQMDEYGGLYV